MSRGGSGRKHLPEQRTCIGCRRTAARGELRRIVVAADGLVWDRLERLPGRGAWVCPTEACSLRGTRQIGRALRTPALRPDEGAIWRAITGAPEPIRFDPDAPPDGPVDV